MNGAARCGTALLLALAGILLAAGLAYPCGASGMPFAAPDAAHWLGTDDIGRDVLCRLAAAAAPTAGIGVAVAACAIALALLVALAGLASPAADAAGLRLAALFNALPAALVLIVLASTFRPGLPAVVALLAVFGWDAEFRPLRVRLRQVWQHASLDAARLAGASTAYLLRRHAWPALAGQLAVQGVGVARRAIFHYAGLAFLGIADPRHPTWGGMLNEAMPYLSHPAVGGWIIATALCLAVLLVGLALLGQGLDGEAA